MSRSFTSKDAARSCDYYAWRKMWWSVNDELLGMCKWSRRGFVLVDNVPVNLMNWWKLSFEVADFHPRLAPGSPWIRSREFVYTSAILGRDLGDHCEPSVPRKPKISCSAQYLLHTYLVVSATGCALLWESFFWVRAGRGGGGVRCLQAICGLCCVHLLCNSPNSQQIRVVPELETMPTRTHDLICTVCTVVWGGNTSFAMFVWLCIFDTIT